MAALPPLNVWVPRYTARYLGRLLRKPSRTLGPLPLGPVVRKDFRTLIKRYPASRSLADRYRSRFRHDWNRIRIPLYGSPRVTIPGVRVTVPSGLQFRYDNEELLPRDLASITFANTRNQSFYERYGVPHPSHEMLIRVPPHRTGGRTPGPPPEESRRRHDAKPFGYFRRYYRLQHAIHSYDEYLEFLAAWQNSRTPTELATSLALNQWVDYAYGTRGRFLRDKVYRNRSLWNLPVGYDTLSRIWR